MSHSAMEELRLAQVEETVTELQGNKDNDYLFPETEKHLYHVLIQPGGYDPNSGKPLAAAYRQKFTEQEFDQSEKSRSLSGKKVTILHDPTKKGQGEQGSTNGEVDATTELEAARVMYKSLTGEEADKRWGLVKLSFEIEAAQQREIDAANENKPQGDATVGDRIPENVPSETTGDTNIPNNPASDPNNNIAKPAAKSK